MTTSQHRGDGREKSTAALKVVYLEFDETMKQKASLLHEANCARQMHMEGHDENQVVCRACKKRVVVSRERNSITWVSTRLRDRIKTYACSWLTLLYVLIQPLKSLEKTLTRRCATGVDIPRTITHAMQTQLLGNLCRGHGSGKILLVGKDEQ